VLVINEPRDLPESVDLDVHWMHGSRAPRRTPEPAIQVHACTPDTYVLRQSKNISYEAPFLYLLFGNRRAILFDTGATEDVVRFPLRPTIDRLVETWLSSHPVDDYQLVVAHTHSHRDHVAGDRQFTDRPNTVVVGHEMRDVQEFFGITDWPREVVPFDLGGRTMQIFATPGHHRAAVAAFDPSSGFLLTGDTVYPGRLYVEDFPAFRDSVERLVAFADAHAVTHVMGCHVEMSQTPRRDYPIGTRYQPDEAPLQMTVEQLRAVQQAAAQVAAQPGAHQFDDFAIYHGPCRKAMTGQAARTLLGWLRSAVQRYGGSLRLPRWLT
jgi:hydroxyacylglutathione hydrolase